MTRYFAILCPFVFFVLVQGQELKLHVDKLQLRALAGSLQNITQKNLVICQTNREYFELYETETTPEDVTLLRKQIFSFDIFDISVMPSNRLVIQAFERKSGNDCLLFIHCTISEPVNDGISNLIQSYRTLKGIGRLPLARFTLSRVWKYERLGVNSNRIQVMGPSLFHVEDVSNVDGSRMGCRRFIIRCEDKWMIFSSNHFGMYPVLETNRVFIVIAEIAGTHDEDLLHYYAIDVSSDLLGPFFGNVNLDTKAYLNTKLTNMMEPILRNNINY